MVDNYEILYKSLLEYLGGMVNSSSFKTDIEDVITITYKTSKYGNICGSIIQLLNNYDLLCCLVNKESGTFVIKNKNNKRCMINIIKEV